MGSRRRPAEVMGCAETHETEPESPTCEPPFDKPASKENQAKKKNVVLKDLEFSVQLGDAWMYRDLDAMAVAAGAFVGGNGATNGPVTEDAWVPIKVTKKTMKKLLPHKV